jgi:hypothetical protein
MNCVNCHAGKAMLASAPRCPVGAGRPHRRSVSIIVIVEIPNLIIQVTLQWTPGAALLGAGNADYLLQHQTSQTLGQAA